MDVETPLKQAKPLKRAGRGLSLLEVLLMITLLSATILPCALMLTRTGQNARDVYLQSTRSILLNSLQDEQTVDRNNYAYTSVGMNTDTSESGQVIPWRSVVDVTNAGASDSFQKTVFYYLYNTAADAANAPRYSTKVIQTRNTLRVRFDSLQAGYMDSSGQWWNPWVLYNGAAMVPGINNASSVYTNYPAQAITNLPSHRDADIYRGGWYRNGASITYSAPVSTGLYTVKLYFADNSVASTRLMDIVMEGKLMNPGNPYFAPPYCGSQSFCANVQMFDVMVTDGNLDITISPNSNTVNDDPYIQALSIKKRT
ncbi:malectin domain-containing carbohydrate-binding protein [Vampirovibrio chlorellavorus]|uniref:malectin domain-containing carbohydrate-binding protein n=1 Tax=Vampirovibrio chlorellavorus TaxID=758823 RepID=UPI0026F19B99|nr:malectin domain-containing carbohydrate-binding protein [Vampirovibrio chlorellavorus]